MTSDVGLGRVPDPISRANHDQVDVRSERTVPGRTGNEGRVAERDRWQLRYARMIATGDLLAIAVVVVIGEFLGFGSYAESLGGDISPWVGLLSGASAVGGLYVWRAWEPARLGQGSEEFSRLTRGMVGGAVVLALIGLSLEASAVRPWVFGLIPLMGILCLLLRYGFRRWLHVQRRRGRYVHSALVVGSVDSVADLIRRTQRETNNGWVVNGACTPTGAGVDGAGDILGVPVVGDLDVVADIVRHGGYQVVSVARASGWTPRRMHQLAWDLEGVGADLVVDPGLMEVAGPRLHVSLVDGLPLLRLTQPALDGLPRLVKGAVDRIGAILLIVAVLPLLLGLAVAVRMGGGPVLFRQTRVGRHGNLFKMIKFRSMVCDAESRRGELEACNEGDGPLFKIRHDPRVTRLGAWMRRYSLDELPQLFNVVAGSMSLVGPRPPLPEEVATYDRDAARKLRVRPGLTGLWQVSGRSDLSWEESVRLDLRYVENWTLALDALIMWKTLGAITRGHGAY